MSTPLPPRFPDDLTNPYSAPEAEIGPGQYAGYGLSPTPFTVGDVLSRSWQIFKPQMWKCIGVVVFLIVLNFAGQMLLNLVPVLVPRDVDPRVGSAVFFIMWIGVMLLQIWLGIGQALFMLRVARGQDSSFNDVFQGGRWILPVIGASLVFGLAIGGVIALCMIPALITMAALGGNQGAALVVFGVCALIAVVVLIVVTLRLSQFYYLIIDRGAGVMESLRLSVEVTRGNAGNLLVLGFMTWIINIAGALACLVGLFFTMPFTVLLFPVAYLALTGQPIADPLAQWKPVSDPGILGPDGPVADTF